MPGNFKREDLRIQKTRRSLLDALHTLLARQSFSKISVYDICEEALVSRTAFYAHFQDKYDLLEHLLTARRQTITQMIHETEPEQLNQTMLAMLHPQTEYLRHLLEDANLEQLALLLQALAPTENPFSGASADIGSEVIVKYDPTDLKDNLFTCFISGGLFGLLRSYAMRVSTPANDLLTSISFTMHMLRSAHEWYDKH